MLLIIRRLFSSFFFLMLTLSGVLIIPVRLYQNVTGTQLGPVLLKMTTGSEHIMFAGTVLMFFGILIMGRAYCSFLCPLGYLQDISIRLGKVTGIISDFRISNKTTAKIIRIALLFFLIVMFLSGFGFLTGLLDPFSFYSRFLFILTRAGNFKTTGGISLVSCVIILSSTLTVLLVSVKFGRLYCSWICPVGTALWGFSTLSIFRLKIDQTLCNGCNKCSDICKSGAIDKIDRKIDAVFCVACFKCPGVCKSEAIKIERKSFHSLLEKDISKGKNNLRQNTEGRRKFIKQIASGVLLFSMPVELNRINYGSEVDQKRNIVFPPGAEDYKRFISQCTGCMQCALKCPTKIIYPATGISGSSPVLPVLNFKNGYCSEDCVACSQVCPTNALQKLSVVIKKKTKIADLVINTDECIVSTDSLECNVCAEICPVTAIKMIPQPGALPVPAVIQSDCIGCGKCLLRCPSKKNESIFTFNRYKA
jgi:ferredoxin